MEEIHNTMRELHRYLRTTSAMCTICGERGPVILATPTAIYLGHGMALHHEGFSAPFLRPLHKDTRRELSKICEHCFALDRRSDAYEVLVSYSRLVRPDDVWNISLN